MNEHPLIPLFFILICMALSLALTLRITKILSRYAYLDHPNERSSHSTPTPRGGGWALILVIVPVMLLAAIIDDGLNQYAGLFFGTSVLVLISWLDDRHGINPGLRLLLHFVATLLGTLSLPSDAVLLGHALPVWLDRIVLIVGWTWFLNLYNFMDGIDGITATETICLATGMGVLTSAIGLHDPFFSIMVLALIGSCLGFLALNWSPAKIFMGDVGSIPLGYLTGFLLIWLASKGCLLPALILALYYVSDSGITIVSRAARGEKIWRPHRQHFYQQAVQRGRRHATVVFAIVATNVVLIVAALLSLRWPWTGLGLALLVVAILLIWMHKPGLAKD